MPPLRHRQSSRSSCRSQALSAGSAQPQAQPVPLSAPESPGHPHTHLPPDRCCWSALGPAVLGEQLHVLNAGEAAAGNHDPARLQVLSSSPVVTQPRSV